MGTLANLPYTFGKKAVILVFFFFFLHFLSSAVGKLR